MTTTTDVNEFPMGPLRLPMTFYDLSGAVPVLADPTAGKLGIQLRATTPTIVDFTAWVQDGTGLWHYVFDPTGFPGEYMAQVKGTGTIVCTSQPYAFTVSPDTVPGL